MAEKIGGSATPGTLSPRSSYQRWSDGDCISPPDSVVCFRSVVCLRRRCYIENGRRERCGVLSGVTVMQGVKYPAISPSASAPGARSGSCLPARSLNDTGWNSAPYPVEAEGRQGPGRAPERHQRGDSRSGAVALITMQNLIARSSVSRTSPDRADYLPHLRCIGSATPDRMRLSGLLFSPGYRATAGCRTTIRFGGG